MFDNDISMGTQNRHGGGGATFKNIFENPVIFIKGIINVLRGEGLCIRKSQFISQTCQNNGK